MDDAKLRAWWSHRQGLDGDATGASPSAILERTGWARSVGGVGPYMTMHSRAGSTRAEMDAAAASQEIHELPSARGCTYVVPRRDFALALRVGQDSGRSEMNVAYKLGVSDDEIEKLCTAIVDALTSTPEPLSPDQIREATGDASRGLGEEGAKKGMTTTLPLALGRLQSDGLIRRVPVNGRLDQQRYAYTLFQPNPLEGSKLSPDVAYRELAERFFRWVGPATPAEFQFFSGLGVKGSQAILEHLNLVPVEAGSPRLLFADDLEEFQSFKGSDEPRYALVSSLDPVSANRRDVGGLLDVSLHTHPSIDTRGRAAGSTLADLPYNAILEHLNLVPVEAGSPRLLFADDLEEFQSFKGSDEPRYALVSSLDPVSANRRDVGGLLDVSLHTHPSIDTRGRAAGSTLADLPYNAILDRGRLAGFWEYDPEAQTIVWMTFAPESAALQSAIAETEAFVRDDLGDARTFSLDSPKARRPRIDALKAFANK